MEIALSLGVVSFGVVGLIGLLAASFDSSRASDEDTLVASMARQVVAELRVIPFDTLNPGVANATGPQPFYFDHEAHRLPSGTGAIYQCIPAITANSDFMTQGTTGSATKPNMYDVRMPFSRAALGQHAPALQTLHASLARYE